MRRLHRALAFGLAGLLLAGPLPGARAVGEGVPSIESPVQGAALYAGFTGPFVVDFSDAPLGTYDYYVEQVDGAGQTVRVRSAQEPFKYTGPITRPEFTFRALPAGSGYTFRVTNGAGTEASRSFTVRPGPPPTCSIKLPTAVRMTGRSVLLRATLGERCKTLRTVYAAWEARHPAGGFAQTFIFDRVRTDTWRIFDDERTGVYTVRPNAARNAENQQVPQNTVRVTMKMDARLALRATRAGNLVTLRTAATRYSPSANRYVAWGQRRVVLSVRACDRCAWKRLGVRTTDRRGAASLRVRAVGTRQYRVTAAGTSSTWAPRVPVVRR